MQTRLITHKPDCNMLLLRPRPKMVTDTPAAYVPDLPGCIATGKTREEVELLIRKAIEYHIEGVSAVISGRGGARIDYKYTQRLKHGPQKLEQIVDVAIECVCKSTCGFNRRISLSGFDLRYGALRKS